MDKKEIKWHEKNASLCQAVSGIAEFVMLSDEWEQVTPFMFCKDYMQDAIWARIHKTKASIWGFSHDGSNGIQPSSKSFKLGVVNANDEKFKEKWPNLIEFINQIDEKMGFRKTIFYEAEKIPKPAYKKGVLIIDADKRWMHSPTLVSMFTLLIRLGFTHSLGSDYKELLNEVVSEKKPSYCNVDASRLKYAIKGINFIINSGFDKVFCDLIEDNYPKSCTTLNMHNNSGIVAFSSGTTKSIFTKWKSVA